MTDKPSPVALWQQARDETPGTAIQLLDRYLDLMEEHGYVSSEPSDCIPDTAHFYEGDEEGYMIICENSEHKKRPEPCPCEREMFRKPRDP